MTAYAYLRVSTDQQDVDNQRYGLFMYANTHGLGPLRFVEDTASGRPKGATAARRKLDAKEGEIRGYLAKVISKRSIAKLVECAPSTLYAWLARRNLQSRRATTASRS